MPVRRGSGALEGSEGMSAGVREVLARDTNTGLLKGFCHSTSWERWIGLSLSSDRPRWIARFSKWLVMRGLVWGRGLGDSNDRGASATSRGSASAVSPLSRSGESRLSRGKLKSLNCDKFSGIGIAKAPLD